MPNFVIHSDGTRLPLSKGILSQEIATVGVPIDTAYDIAQEMEDSFKATKEIEFEKLNAAVKQSINDQVSAETARRWEQWGKFKSSGVPLIILITGGNGTGKSTFASQLCTRLGINRLTSTDSIREVMRALSVESLVPQLYQSSYRVSPPPGARTNDTVSGFLHQSNSVLIGIQAIISRAIKEHTSMILEGIHLLPSIATSIEKKDAIIIPLTLMVSDPREHYRRFGMRDLETTGDRPASEYIPYFKSIRAIHDYLVNEAFDLGHLVIDTTNIDEYLPQLVDRIIDAHTALDTE